MEWKERVYTEEREREREKIKYDQKKNLRVGQNKKHFEKLNERREQKKVGWLIYGHIRPC